jgi:hypothetical protein
MTVPNTDKETLQNAIFDNVEIGSTLMTDEHRAYIGLAGSLYELQTVNQVGGGYRRGPLIVGIRFRQHFKRKKGPVAAGRALA